MGFLLTTICFDIDVISSSRLAEIIANGIGFDPSRLISDVFLKNGGKYQKKIHLNRIAKSKDISSLRLETIDGEDGPLFEFISLPTWGFQSIHWKLKAGIQVPDNELWKNLIEMDGFNAGYVADADDVFWQSEENISTYELFGKNHNSFPKIKDEVFGGDKIDILKNPGARYIFPGMWLQASWKMWFSGKVFKYIPKYQLSSFSDADKVVVLPNDVVYIELCSNLTDSMLRQRQISFREWVGMSELAAQANQLGAEITDPVFDIAEGVYPHGGVRKITQWLDNHGKPIRKSKSKKSKIFELDQKGKVLWSEEGKSL